MKRLIGIKPGQGGIRSETALIIAIGDDHAQLSRGRAEQRPGIVADGNDGVVLPHTPLREGPHPRRGKIDLTSMNDQQAPPPWKQEPPHRHGPKRELARSQKNTVRVSTHEAEKSYQALNIHPVTPAVQRNAFDRITQLLIVSLVVSERVGALIGEQVKGKTLDPQGMQQLLGVVADPPGQGREFGRKANQ
jgi:hypothetical protein